MVDFVYESPEELERLRRMAELGVDEVIPDIPIKLYVVYDDKYYAIQHGKHSVELEPIDGDDRSLKILTRKLYDKLVNQGRIKLLQFHTTFLERMDEVNDDTPLPSVGDTIRDHVSEDEYYTFRVKAVGNEKIIIEEVEYNEIEIMTVGQYRALVASGQFQHIKES